MGTRAKNIAATTVDEAERLLNIAVEELQRQAVEEGTGGILVTRTGVGRFTVELTEVVPYGVTDEAVADTTGF